MENFSGRVIAVTGGAQGIGKAIAGRLLTRGAVVVIADIDEEAGQECLAEWGYPRNALLLRTDVAEEKSVAGCIDEIVRRFLRLDGVVNNAGIANPGATPIEKTPLTDWQRLLATNLTGCFLMAKHAVPHLRKSRGAIVNIASTRALQSEANTEAYSAAKGGLLSLTHALAISLGPEVRVNCISPGWIDTRAWRKKELREYEPLRPIDHTQHPAGRVGTPEDVAGMVAFLLSAEAQFITGQNFIIDGGMTRKMLYAP
ncbi:SDR family oxidoreductase [Thiovibrio sp. JS02]